MMIYLLQITTQDATPGKTTILREEKNMNEEAIN
jgi:hypothetical protein